MTKILPEYSAHDVSVKDIHLSLLLDGCCLLRGMFDKSSIDQIANKVEAIYKRKAELAHAGQLEDGAKRAHIFDAEFQEYHPGESLHDLVENTKLFSVLESILGTSKISRSAITNCRSVDARDVNIRDITSFPPLSLHIDAPYHPPYDKFTINFWTPLIEGCGLNRPGLQVLPMSHVTTRRIIGFTPEESFDGYTGDGSDTSQWSMKIISNKIIQACPNAILWHPQFAIGDVMIMTSWVPHSSYVPPNAQNMRRSLEIRFHGEEIDPRPIVISSLEELGLPYYSRVHIPA